MTGRQWVIELPCPTAWITSNQRLHWAERSRRTRTWRSAAAWQARAQHLEPMHRAHILAELRFTDRRRRDPLNWAPSIKAAVDGLVSDFGLLPDDDAAHLLGPDLRLGPVDQLPGVRLTITDLGPAPGVPQRASPAPP